jgi:SAM-dependent methyltransferase
MARRTADRSGGIASLTREQGAVFSDAAERIRTTKQFKLEDIDLVADAIGRYDILSNTPWDNYRAAHCVLPDWFRMGLDPVSDEYAAQQRRLWSVLSGVERPYAPEIDEQEIPLANVDAVRRPGYFMRRDSQSVTLASDQVIATGMILKHGGLKPGEWALEYGAGFAATALTLARLGVAVDTVDISPAFCHYVEEQAKFFQVPLTPFEGRFGWNPRPGHQYDLIYFFQSFHHCADFLSVLHDLKRHLLPTGRILLSGEPIARTEDAFLPYPWGLRLEAEPVAQVRRFHWFELGFTEEFLARVFVNAGFSAQRFDGPPLGLSDVYVFKRRAQSIHLFHEWLPDILESGWNTRETEGRWTKGEARLLLDVTDSFSELVISATNHHPFALPLEIEYGSQCHRVRFKAGQHKEIVIQAKTKGVQIAFRSPAYAPARDYPRKPHDPRTLGIFVHSVSYQ